MDVFILDNVNSIGKDFLELRDYWSTEVYTFGF